MTTSIKNTIIDSIDSIEEHLKKEDDIIIKYDKKNDCIKIYSQKPKKINK